MSRVAVAHSESYPHRDHLKGLMDRGPFIMFDNCGQFTGLGQFENQILDVIRDLIDAGYENQILLSHDTCKFPQFRIHGGPGFVYLAESFLPALAERDIPESVLTTMTNDNPRRWLTGQ